ncbi:MAG TPA: hypothetical protein VGO33_03995 [Gemmatimonadaceae bacterium]|jgi:hypothetical protein|nr:hypothetical protein [Gemmatimonadaceae bacterium]
MKIAPIWPPALTGVAVAVKAVNDTLVKAKTCVAAAIGRQPTGAGNMTSTQSRSSRKSLAGAAVVVIGRALGFATDVVSIVGAALSIGVRIIAMHRHWQLPVARPRAGTATDND